MYSFGVNLSTIRSDIRRYLKLAIFIIASAGIVTGACENFKDLDKYLQYIPELKEESKTTGQYGEDIAIYTPGLSDLNPGEYSITVMANSVGHNECLLIDPTTNHIYGRKEYSNSDIYTSFYIELPEYVREIQICSVLDADGDLIVRSCSVNSEGYVYRDARWIAVLSLMVVFLLAYGIYRTCIKVDGNPIFLLLTVLACLLCIPVLTINLPQANDTIFHLARIAGIANGLRNGVFPVYINTDFLYGAGTITPIMYPDLFLYPGAFICAHRGSLLLAYNFTYIYVTFFTVYLSYYSARQLLGRGESFLFSLFYSLNPYRIQNFTARSAIGEFIAMTFIPIVIVGFIQIIRNSNRIHGVYYAVLGMTGILQSHILSVAIVCMFVMIYLLAYIITHYESVKYNVIIIITIIVAGLITLLVNACFIVPFVNYCGTDFQIYHALTNEFMSNGVMFWQLFINKFDAQNINSSSLCIGTGVTVAIMLLILSNLTKLLKIKTNSRKMCIHFAEFGTLALYMASAYFPWALVKNITPDIYKLFSHMQFPFRFLIITVCAYSASAAIIVYQILKSHNLRWTASIIIIFVLMDAVVPMTRYISGDNFMEDKTSYRTEVDQYFDYLKNKDQADLEKWRDVVKSNQRPEVLKGNISIEDHERKNGTYVFTFQGKGTDVTAVRVPMYYYGLSKAELNGNQIAIQEDEKSELTDVIIPSGVESGTIVIKPSIPLYFYISLYVSLVTSAVLVLSVPVKKMVVRKNIKNVSRL